MDAPKLGLFSSGNQKIDLRPRNFAIKEKSDAFASKSNSNPKNLIQEITQYGYLPKNSKDAKRKDLEASLSLNPLLTDPAALSKFYNTDVPGFYKLLGVCLKGNFTLTKFYKNCYELLSNSPHGFVLRNGQHGIIENIFLITYMYNNQTQFFYAHGTQVGSNFSVQGSPLDMESFLKVRTQLYSQILKQSGVWFRDEKNWNFFLAILDSITASPVDSQWKDEFLVMIGTVVQARLDRKANFELNSVISIITFLAKGDLITKSDIQQDTLSNAAKNIQKTLRIIARAKISQLSKSNRDSEPTFSDSYFYKALRNSYCFDFIYNGLLNTLWNIFKNQKSLGDDAIVSEIIGIGNFFDLPENIRKDFHTTVNRIILNESHGYSIAFLTKFFMVFTQGKGWDS
jgi:hypothetical protein